LYTAGCILLQEKEIFIIIKALDGFLVECELGCMYEFGRKIGDFTHALPACLLNILKAKAVKRDSTIKNINVPCRFSFSFISGVRFGLWDLKFFPYIYDDEF
jgi:hypothetical protein